MAATVINYPPLFALEIAHVKDLKNFMLGLGTLKTRPPLAIQIRNTRCVTVHPADNDQTLLAFLSLGEKGCKYHGIADQKIKSENTITSIPFQSLYDAVVHLGDFDSIRMEVSNNRSTVSLSATSLAGSPPIQPQLIKARHIVRTSAMPVNKSSLELSQAIGKPFSAIAKKTTLRGVKWDTHALHALSLEIGNEKSEIFVVYKYYKKAIFTKKAPAH